jgi:hypothetical protein
MNKEEEWKGGRMEEWKGRMDQIKRRTERFPKPMDLEPRPDTLPTTHSCILPLFRPSTVPPLREASPDICRISGRVWVLLEAFRSGTGLKNPCVGM